MGPGESTAGWWRTSPAGRLHVRPCAAADLARLELQSHGIGSTQGGRHEVAEPCRFLIKDLT
jgi:hypothetical protein